MKLDLRDRSTATELLQDMTLPSRHSMMNSQILSGALDPIQRIWEELGKSSRSRSLNPIYKAVTKLAGSFRLNKHSAVSKTTHTSIDSCVKKKVLIVNRTITKPQKGLCRIFFRKIYQLIDECVVVETLLSSWPRGEQVAPNISMRA